MKISLQVTELSIVQEFLENFNQRDISCKLGKGGQDSKTCLKRPLTNRQNKDFDDIW